jgi:hypothetical protein
MRKISHIEISILVMFLTLSILSITILKSVDEIQQTRVVLPLKDIQMLGRNMYLKGLHDWGDTIMTQSQIDSFVIKSIKK